MSQLEYVKSGQSIEQAAAKKFRISDALPWCFLLFAFGVPFSIVWAHIALGVWLLVWLVSLSLGQIRWKRTPLDIPVLVFLAVDLLTGLLGINPLKSLVHFVSLWHISVYLLVVHSVPDRRWMERGLTALFLMTALNASYGMAQFWSNDYYFFRSPEQVARYATGLNREIGTFDHSMTFAGQMNLVAIFGVGILLEWKKGVRALFWNIPIVLVFSALLLSYQRNAWLGGVSGVMMLGAMKGKKTFVILGTGILGVILALSIFQVQFFPRLLSIGDPNYPSNLPRINMARVTFELFKEHPIVGVGPGNYGQASVEHRAKYEVINKSHPHNNLFSQVAEKGLVGLVVYLFLWWVFYKATWKIWMDSKVDYLRAVSAGGIGAVTGFHVAGMFEANFGDSEVAMMMWLIVGLVMWVRFGGTEKGMKINGNAI